MKVQMSIVMTVLVAILGSWVLMKPPSNGVERLATGEIVRSDVTVTRAPPTSSILLASENAAHDSQLLQQTISSVLDGLGFPIAEVAPVMIHSVSMGVLDEAVVAGLEASPLAALIIQGISERIDDASIDAMVNTAAANGEFVVPSALVTTDGTVDTAALLASVLNGAKQRSGQEMQAVDQPNAIYTVVEGDSLAAIAASLYGDMSAYPKLLEANPTVLSSPADISVGMRFLVPPT